MRLSQSRAADRSTLNYEGASDAPVAKSRRAGHRGDGTIGRQPTPVRRDTSTALSIRMLPSTLGFFPVEKQVILSGNYSHGLNLDTC